MAQTSPTPSFVRLANFFMVALLRIGVNMGGTTLLTVRGRKSGELRTTPVTIIEQEGQRWITAPYGAVNWVRNLRAAGEGTLKRGRHVEKISAVELPTQEAALVLQKNLGRFPSFVRQHYAVTPTSSLQDFERDAPHHPVFLVQTAGPK